MRLSQGDIFMKIVVTVRYLSLMDINMQVIMLTKTVGATSFLHSCSFFPQLAV